MPARQNRVTRGDEYRRIVRNGQRIGGRLCVTYAAARPADAPARFGFIVSKAVGNAVVRNRVRRRLKSISQSSIQAGFQGVDVVFRALPASADAAFTELDQEVNRSLSRIQATQSLVGEGMA